MCRVIVFRVVRHVCVPPHSASSLPHLCCFADCRPWQSQFDHCILYQCVRLLFANESSPVMALAYGLPTPTFLWGHVNGSTRANANGGKAYLELYRCITKNFPRNLYAPSLWDAHGQFPMWCDRLVGHWQCFTSCFGALFAPDARGAHEACQWCTTSRPCLRFHNHVPSMSMVCAGLQSDVAMA